MEKKRNWTAVVFLALCAIVMLVVIKVIAVTKLIGAWKACTSSSPTIPITSAAAAESEHVNLWAYADPEHRCHARKGEPGSCLNIGWSKDEEWASTIRAYYLEGYQADDGSVEHKLVEYTQAIGAGAAGERVLEIKITPFHAFDPAAAAKLHRVCDPGRAIGWIASDRWSNTAQLVFEQVGSGGTPRLVDFHYGDVLCRIPEGLLERRFCSSPSSENVYDQHEPIWTSAPLRTR